jgi:histidinol-phosphatase (PHP family)
MIRCNLHTHTRFSDGSGAPEEYCEEAVRQGFDILGFSDHGPVPFENTFAIRNDGLKDYVGAILRVKAEYSLPGVARRNEEAHGSIPQHLPLQVLLGLEMDYVPGVSRPIGTLRQEFPFDYLIGSVHLVKNEETGKLWFIDGPAISVYDKGLQEVFDGDARYAVTSYYRQIQSMILERPDIIGHLDKIKMYNRDRYFSENDPWYIQLIDETLQYILDSGCVVEVNTRGFYKKKSETFFPGPAILRKLNHLHIPVTLVSDAHKPHELSLCFDEASGTLKELGFKTTVVRTGDGWKEIVLD